LAYETTLMNWLQKNRKSFRNFRSINDFVKAGTIRQIGLSNETPWGTLQYLQTAKDHNLPRPVTVQNSYSLIHRGYEYGMSEVSLREDIGLLAYSPLAQGVLTENILMEHRQQVQEEIYFRVLLLVIWAIVL
jgi:aryl-alcohol dehydrogenase-like predicted oxidoreductase